MTFRMVKFTVMELADEMIAAIKSGSSDPMAMISADDYADLNVPGTTIKPQARVKTAMTHKRDDYWNYHARVAKGADIVFTDLKRKLRDRKAGDVDKAFGLFRSLEGQDGWLTSQYHDHLGNMQLRPGLAVIAHTLGGLPEQDMILRVSQQGHGHLHVWQYVADQFHVTDTDMQTGQVIVC